MESPWPWRGAAPYIYTSLLLYVASFPWRHGVERQYRLERRADNIELAVDTRVVGVIPISGRELTSLTVETEEISSALRHQPVFVSHANLETMDGSRPPIVTGPALVELLNRQLQRSTIMRAISVPAKFLLTFQCRGCDVLQFRLATADNAELVRLRLEFVHSKPRWSIEQGSVTVNSGALNYLPTFRDELQTLIAQLRPALLHGPLFLLACWLLALGVGRIAKRLEGGFLAGLSAPWSRTQRGVPSLGVMLGCLLSAAAILFIVYLKLVVMGDSPAVPDSVAFLLQSQIFASGQWVAPPPPSPRHFSMLFMTISEHGWHARYPFGWTLFLALGQLWNAPWLVCIFLALTLIWGVARLGSLIFDRRVGWLAGTLLAMAPFFQMNAASYMNHVFSANLIVWSFSCHLFAARHKHFGYFGVTWLLAGWLFYTRPASAAVLLLLLAANSLLDWRHWKSRGLWKAAAAATIALAIPVSIGWLYSRATGGAISVWGQYIAPANFSMVGTAAAKENLIWPSIVSSVGAFLRSGSIFPLGIGMTLAAAAMVRLLQSLEGRRLIILALFLCLPYGLWTSTSHIFFGARYWFEPFVLWSIVGAVGVSQLWQWLRQLLGGRDRTAGCVLLLTIAISVLPTLRTWYFGTAERDRLVVFSPEMADELRYLWRRSGILQAAAKKLNEPSVIFIKSQSGFGTYECAGMLNDPANLADSPVWFVRDLGDAANQELDPFILGRERYRGDCLSSQLRPYPRNAGN